MTTRLHALATGASIFALGLPLSVVALPSADAAPRVVRYASCAQLNRVYPHGVARPKARDLRAGKFTRYSVRNFKVNKDVYARNIHLDRDRDGVACEKP